jgi:hypothetical protein
MRLTPFLQCWNHGVSGRTVESGNNCWRGIGGVVVASPIDIESTAKLGFQTLSRLGQWR